MIIVILIILSLIGVYLLLTFKSILFGTILMFGCPFILTEIIIPSKVEKKRRNFLFGNKIIGLNLSDFENELGTHTSTISNTVNKKVYKWGDYLELQFNKENICTEVLYNKYEN